MERTAWRRCALRTLASRGGCRRTGGRVVVAARPARGRRRPHLAVHVHIVGRLHDVQYGALGRADVHIRPYLDFGRKRKRSGSHGHLRGAERAPRHGGQGERGGDVCAKGRPGARGPLLRSGRGPRPTNERTRAVPTMANSSEFGASIVSVAGRRGKSAAARRWGQHTPLETALRQRAIPRPRGALGCNCRTHADRTENGDGGGRRGNVVN